MEEKKQLIVTGMFLDEFPKNEEMTEFIEVICLEYYEQEAGKDYSKYYTTDKKALLELIKNDKRLTTIYGMWLMNYLKESGKLKSDYTVQNETFKAILAHAKNTLRETGGNADIVNEWFKKECGLTNDVNITFKEVEDLLMFHDNLEEEEVNQGTVLSFVLEEPKELRIWFCVNALEHIKAKNNISTKEAGDFAKFLGRKMMFKNVADLSETSDEEFNDWFAAEYEKMELLYKISLM